MRSWNPSPAPFAREVLIQAAADGKPVALIMDQSKLSDRHPVLMLAVRCGERALPLAWRVETTEGGIGFETQKELLEAVAPWLPRDASVMLLGDRFDGTPDLITWCRDHGWDYRLRLKGNLVVVYGGAKTTTGACADAGIFRLEDVALTAKRVRTNIGIIRDPSHAEPWIIAMSDQPGYLRTLDYSQRWGIEPMFSDFKTRGFGIEDTQIHYDPLCRPARPSHPGYGAGSLLGGVHRNVGCRPSSSALRKKSQADKPRKVARGRTSWFTRGLRRIVKLFQSCLPLPPLWSVLLN